MKAFILLPIIAGFCLFTLKAGAQDEQEQLNLPGDNLNLYAVMKLFQESPTLEGFENKLNDQSTKINNLDLDGNNQIDYIKVVDNVVGETHNIALKVAVSKDEDQDVAVFVVKKDRNGQVIIQLIGDEDLYGKDYIIEPNTGSSTPTPNPGYSGNQPPPVYEQDEVYAVSSWPVVQFIYVPTYSVWRSPWRWGYYPSYWRPWTPFFWHEYYGYQYHWNYYYRAHYRYTPVYRFPDWRDRYYGGGFRSRSVFVETRARNGNYRQTYTRPDLANRGADLFRMDHPGAPNQNRPLPRFDNNNNYRPIINRTDRGNNGRPGDGNNSNRPVNPRPNDRNNNNNRPVTPRPDNGNNTPGRPITRPVNPTPGPDNGNGNNAPNRPVTRPVNPAPRPADGNNIPNRPVTRPAITPRPVDGNNTPNRPVTRPANGNNFPARPVTRPAAPGPQQSGRPAGRPANERPPREPRGNN
jgi:hypothetical protein